MVRVLGNSSERVVIKDLNDVIYYRQKKDYTDQEYSNSKDLQREMGSGRVLKLETFTSRAPVSDDLFSDASKISGFIDTHEIRKVASEVVVENKSRGEDLKEFLTNIKQILAETVRQEISKISVQGLIQQDKMHENNFQELVYIPEVSTEGLNSKIHIGDGTSNASDISNSLKALRRLQELK
jgi:hypothetical protein